MRRKAVATVPFLVKRVQDGNCVAGALEGYDPSKDAALAALRKREPDRAETALGRAMKSPNASVKAWAIKKIGG